VIQKTVQDPLAEQLLSGKIRDGDTVKLTVKSGALAINGQPVKAAA
jgi:ATP-dependent Clp protease ATP-binding subunit ClpB